MRSLLLLSSKRSSSPQKETSCPLSRMLHTLPPPTLGKPCLLSLWLYLFWIVHVNGVINYVVICIWLISFTIIFYGSSMGWHILGLHSFLSLNNIPLWIHTAFCVVIHPLIKPGEFLCASKKKLYGHLQQRVSSWLFILNSVRFIKVV